MRIYCLLIFLVFFATLGNAKNSPLSIKDLNERYALLIPTDSLIVNKNLDRLADSTINNLPILTSQHFTSDIEKEHISATHTLDFYFLIILIFILGIIRFIDIRYFINLRKAIFNISHTSVQQKEQIKEAGLPNLLMNVFFTLSIGTYLFYVLKFYLPRNADAFPSFMLITAITVGIGAIYLLKYLAVRFSGWAFRVEAITDEYLFNVFLINKFIGILLVPFTLAIAFENEEWTKIVIIISFVAYGIFLSMRYFRSWQLFESFLQFSKFHFFLYLCASEFLPLAVLVKLLVNGFFFKNV